MKYLVFLLFMAHVQNVYAVGQSDISIRISCLGGDGAPLTGDLANQCCANGGLKNTPECNVGFHSIKYASLDGIGAAIQIANQTMSVAQQLAGVAYDTSAVVNTDELNATDAGGKPFAAALNSGSAPSVSVGGYETNAGKDLNDSSSGSVGSSASSVGAGGLGFGLSGGGSGGSKTGKSDAASKGDQLASKDGTGGYATASGEGGGGGRAGSFGTDGKGGVGEGGIDTNLQFQGAGDSDSHSAQLDEDGKGSADDPSDYFKRIDPSASIFKIVSARYSRKKSLWTPTTASQPQVVPVIKR